MTDYRSHPIAWDREKTARLWRHYSSRPEFAPLYFSRHSGAAVVREILRHTQLSGRRVLDYGCGRGDMLQLLCSEGARCAGLEWSPESAAAARDSLLGVTGFEGVVVPCELPSSFASGSFDAVLLIEVVEHLDETTLESTLREAHRVLKPAGVIIVTTPNTENLLLEQAHCPECGCTFHRWQHLNAFDSAGLARLMSSAGFASQFCAGIVLRDGGCRAFLRRGIRRAIDYLRGGTREGPQLVYVGTARGESTVINSAPS